MSTEESIKHLEFKLETLRGYQLKQIGDLVATYNEIEEIKRKIEQIKMIHEEHHELLENEILLKL